MKYNIGDNLYYVCPYIFTIEVLNIAFMHDSYYCDETYAMFKEEDLFESFEEAQQEAFDRLCSFFIKKKEEIYSNKPKFTWEDFDG